MKKVLFTATLDVFMNQFQIPYLKLFKENGYEVYVGTSEDGLLPYTDKKLVIPFSRNPFSFKNIKAYKELSLMNNLILFILIIRYHLLLLDLLLVIVILK